MTDTWTYPSAWQFALLALAAYRVYRLLAKDTITEPARDAASLPDETAVTLADRPWIYDVGGRSRVRAPKPLRVYLATLIRCPWCAGFYVSAGAWAAWLASPRWALVAATPWAISATVGLTAKNLDA